MPRFLSRAIFLVALLTGALGLAVPALAADTPFSVRYAETLRGNISAVGNASLTCPPSIACTAAQGRTGGSLINNDYTMTNVDIDGDPATFNSSSATVSLPAGATVAWAGLYWGADTSLGNGGAAAPNPASRGSVRFKAASGSYQTVTAGTGDLLASTSQVTRYRGFADVTALVAGSGSYTVADVQAGTGKDRFGGWSLMVAYHDPTQDIRRVNVFDGLGTVDGTHTFSTSIAPFFTPSTGPIDTTIGLLSFEGDAGLANETQKFNGSDLVDALNPANDPMNSTISVDGSYVTAKDPNYANQMGMDIDVSNRSDLLAPNQSSAVLAYTSTGEYFMPAALFLVSDEGPPAVSTSTAGPSVGGLARDGSTLTADPGTWDGTGPFTYEYQWQRCDTAGLNCVDITGKTNPTYTLTPADIDSTVRVLVTAVNDAGSSSPAASTPTVEVTAAPPANTVPPSITGSPADGVTLTADPGAWTGTASIGFAYQWQSCDADGANCTDIVGATDDTYTPGSGDIGNTISVVVTAANDGGEVSAPAAVATDPVVASPPSDTTPPSLSGTVAPSATLTADPGTWTGTAPTFAYQWQRCDDDGSNCVDISDATGDTYTLTTADQGHTVVVVVTATNALGDDSATSAPSALLPAPPLNATPPAIDDDQPAVGDTLTVDHGTWTGTGPFTYEYQWQRCDADGTNCVDVVGETSDSYTLTDADAGQVVTVVVTATNAAGEATTTSQPTATVHAAATPAPTATHTATPTPRPAKARPTTGPLATAAAPPLVGSTSDGADLGDVPGSLVSATSCQQLAGNAKYRRLALRGIGTVRVRAYTTGPATKLTPIVVTTQISHAKTKRVRVRYTLDGRKLRVGRKPRYKAAIAPSKLQRIGIHTVKATVTRTGKRKHAKPIVLKLKTVSCRTLFTAQRWRTTAGAGLRLRIDSRTTLRRLAFKVPAALLPRQLAKKRTVGFMRVFVAGQAKRKRYALKLSAKGRGKLLLKAPGGPRVRSIRGGLAVRGLPARSAVTEITIYRVTKRDGATKPKRYRLRARVLGPGARTLKLSVRPRAPR